MGVFGGGESWLGSSLEKAAGMLWFSLFPAGGCCVQEDPSRCWVWHEGMFTTTVALESEVQSCVPWS